MATFTPNYNFRKPADADFVENDTDLNANWDIVDSKFKNVVVAVAHASEAVDANAGSAVEALYYSTALLSLEAAYTYKITVFVNVSFDTAGGFSIFRIKVSTTTAGTAGTLLTQGQKDHRVASRTEGFQLSALYTPGSNMTRAFKFTFEGGGGVSSIKGSTMTPTHILVEKYITP